MSAPIEAVRAELVAVPLAPELRAYGASVVDVVLVTVRDRDGAEGTGFTYTLGAGAGIVARMVDEVVTPALVGRRPGEWERARRDIAAATRRLGVSVFVPALSAVDIAVWDLRGVASGQPLHALLGVENPEPVPIYGSGRGSNGLTTDELVHNTLAYLADGYPAVKVRAGERALPEDVARLRAVRVAVGDGVRLMVDCNERMEPPDAQALSIRLADLGYLWIEEPLPAEQLTGFADLARRSPVAVATGEHLPGAATFAQYLATTSVAIYQPDAALCGGVTEALRIGELVNAHGRSLAYHSLAELHVHLAAVTGATYVEDFPILAGVLSEQLPVVDGAVRPPDRPGHGIAWDRTAIERFAVPQRGGPA